MLLLCVLRAMMLDQAGQNIFLMNYFFSVLIAQLFTKQLNIHKATVLLYTHSSTHQSKHSSTHLYISVYFFYVLVSSQVSDYKNPVCWWLAVSLFSCLRLLKHSPFQGHGHMRSVNAWQAAKAPADNISKKILQYCILSVNYPNVYSNQQQHEAWGGTRPQGAGCGPRETGSL